MGKISQHFLSQYEIARLFGKSHAAARQRLVRARTQMKQRAEHGVHSYGAFIIGSPQTFLELWENGTASQIWIQDAWIGA